MKDVGVRQKETHGSYERYVGSESDAADYPRYRGRISRKLPHEKTKKMAPIPARSRGSRMPKCLATSGVIVCRSSEGQIQTKIISNSEDPPRNHYPESPIYRLGVGRR